MSAWVDYPRFRGQPEPRERGTSMSLYHLHVWRKTWALFIGFNYEVVQWQFRVSWGGKSSVRAVNGLYWYRNQIEVVAGGKLRYHFRRALG